MQVDLGYTNNTANKLSIENPIELEIICGLNKN